MQAKPNAVPFSNNENEAKSKLADYVYEYLVHIGANNTADSFKNEVIGKSPESQPVVGDSPGFLYNWWCVFWDLYSASPERRDKSDPSLEAKAYHDFCINMNGPPLMNGIHGGHPPFPNTAVLSGGIPPPGLDGINSRYMPPGGARSGAPTPVMGVPPNFPPGQFPPNQQQIFLNEQMRMGQRMPSQAMGYQPGAGNPQIRPQMRPLFESTSNTPPFPPNQMMQNGNMMCPSSTSVMSSPGHGGQPNSIPPGPDGIPQDRFMMMSANMQSQYMSHQDSGTPLGNGPSSMSGCLPGNNEGNIMQTGNAGPTNSGQLQSLLNGGNENEQIKQSPSSMHGGANTAGGTPGSGGPQSSSANMITSGGPGSVAGGMGPSSVHSQSGVVPPNGNISIATSQQQSTPSVEGVSLHQGIGNPPVDDHQEISKIKANLLDGFGQSSMGFGQH